MAVIERTIEQQKYKGRLEFYIKEVPGDDEKEVLWERYNCETNARRKEGEGKE